MTETHMPDRDWTQPGIFEVASGVHRLPLPLPQDGLRAVNVYVLETPQGLVLIDGGWALDASRRRLEEGLRVLGYHASDITRCLVTHIHRDHYTQAITLRRDVDLQVGLGRGEHPSLDVILAAEGDPLTPQLRQLLTAGASSLAQRLARRKMTSQDSGDEWAYPDTWFDGVCTIDLDDRQLTCIPTPGHTRGHVVYADEEGGLLFAGDHVLPHITPSIGFEPAPTPLPLHDYLSSLDQMRSFGDLQLLPAHGPPGGRVANRVKELLEHHEQRLQHCLAAVDGGARTGLEVAQRLRWTRRERRLDDLDDFNQLLAVTETLAHLELHVSRGTLRHRAPAVGGLETAREFELVVDMRKS